MSSSSGSGSSDNRTGSKASASGTGSEIPDEFVRVIGDFISDLCTTFPEVVPKVQGYWKTEAQYAYIEEEADRVAAFQKARRKCVQVLFNFCKQKYPPRFFDFLYQNAEMFADESTVDTEFLPRISFKALWHMEDVTDQTRETLWKYLQLITFSIITDVDCKESFGDTASLFEAIDENVFREKLEETMERIQSMFGAGTAGSESGASAGGDGDAGDSSDTERQGQGQGQGPAMPDAESIHEHISGILGGKLGQLAKEIAEETAESLQLDLGEDELSGENGDGAMKKIFEKLMKNPAKLMGLVKSVGSKLDAKIKSGDLKESELIEEATDMLRKMKGMPGMGNLQSMMSRMGLGGASGAAGMGGGAKVNVNAMESQLNQRLRLAKTKERIRAKAELAAQMRAATASSSSSTGDAKPSATSAATGTTNNNNTSVDLGPAAAPAKRSKRRKGGKH